MDTIIEKMSSTCAHGDCRIDGPTLAWSMGCRQPTELTRDKVRTRNETPPVHPRVMHPVNFYRSRRSYPLISLEVDRGQTPTLVTLQVSMHLSSLLFWIYIKKVVFGLLNRDAFRTGHPSAFHITKKSVKRFRQGRGGDVTTHKEQSHVLVYKEQYLIRHVFGCPVMTHKYRGSQQSSREVKPKFIDSTQGEPKNICKP
jgi:hypothetical protein